MPSPSCPQRWVAWAYCPPPVPHPQHIDLHSPAGTGEERRPYSTEDWGGACPPRMRDAGSGDWPHGWQSRIVNSQPLFRECVGSPVPAPGRTLEPGLRRCLRAFAPGTHILRMSDGHEWARLRLAARDRLVDSPHATRRGPALRFPVGGGPSV